VCVTIVDVVSVVVVIVVVVVDMAAWFVLRVLMVSLTVSL
jgi:hypothetical protein